MPKMGAKGQGYSASPVATTSGGTLRFVYALAVPFPVVVDANGLHAAVRHYYAVEVVYAVHQVLEHGLYIAAAEAGHPCFCIAAVNAAGRAKANGHNVSSHDDLIGDVAADIAYRLFAGFFPSVGRCRGNVVFE